jgi:F0F1-type ATP synthase membrane subunit c/vacuolar-type H+-ATPase subunit K
LNKNAKRNNRWAINDKVFRDNFIVLALIELTFVGASLIDGIIVSSFLEKDAMAVEIAIRREL